MEECPNCKKNALKIETILDDRLFRSKKIIYFFCISCDFKKKVEMPLTVKQAEEEKWK